VLDLDAEFLHYGEPELAVRVDKINRYSSGMAEHKRARRPSMLGLRLLFYPSLAFFRFYVLQRYFLNGWAGYLAARSMFARAPSASFSSASSSSTQSCAALSTADCFWGP
jgi:hypothetical protein